ncbi:cytochrome b/b6 domain-containing protein [Microbaculum marinisediminis]|uniref:Cytochrome b/b6 domain-containing protein n=1 Tax=Microbaculum marinisediminis TaxID=2931392 RepID=A0AAW5QY86_9HYPH|nr:cytochrome b/b6 domain-containing protein [Microbaculum sp. A6E488]MCT8972678.1 cytochrome b/b6 domain-containing protein [Microbaculum sp. A6E488]
MAARMVRVWDPLVRIIHWLLVIAFIIGYVTEGDPLWLHTWAGYVVAGLVVVRIVWGFVGPRHARFSDFVTGPRKAVGYLAGLIRRKAPRYIGHSPAGGAMTVALLVFLAAISVTGMMTLADTDNAGPLAAWFGNPDVVAAREAALAAGQEFRYRSPFKEPHEVLVNITLVLIILHLVGVALASVVHRESLPRAMVTGMKRAE